MYHAYIEPYLLYIKHYKYLLKLTQFERQMSEDNMKSYRLRS